MWDSPKKMVWDLARSAAHGIGAGFCPMAAPKQMVPGHARHIASSLALGSLPRDIRFQDDEVP